MEKKNLISNWLNFNLSDKEKEAFDKLDVSDSYRAISEAAKKFKAPEFDVDQSFEKFLEKRETKTSKSPSLYRLIGGIAAAVIVCMGLFYFLSPTPVTYIAHNTENVQLQLPDGSEVILNDGSELSYTDSSWDENRNISLSGEAFFNVESGNTFQVATRTGLVTVIGTKFNVKDRENYFEVSCYEGIVSVFHNKQSFELGTGQTIRITGDIVTQAKTGFGKPSWLEKKSVFKSTPFSEVVDELERQYDVNISGDLRNTQTLFTGSFYHENLDTALQAITIPLKLEYSINGNNVIFKSGN